MDANSTFLPPTTLDGYSYSELITYAANQFPELSWLARIWWAHYAYWQNDIIATGLMAFFSHEIVYFGRCIPWMIADSLPSIFLKYKIQDKKIPSAAMQWECTKYVLLIHFVVELPLIFTFHPIAHMAGMHIMVPFPEIKTMIGQIILFFVLEDAYHYWIHRLLHWGPLYKHIHAVHHEYAAPFGLAAEYASPWETLALGLGTIGPPIVLSLLTGNLHFLTVLAWVVLRQLQSIDAHSGYEFPFSLRFFLPIWGGSDWHDAHHKYFIGNYSSSFKYWDIMLDTVSGPEAGEKRRAKKRMQMQKAKEAQAALNRS